jgi:integrase
MAESKKLPSGQWRNLVRVKGAPSASITRATKRECDLAAKALEQEIRDGKRGKFPQRTLAEGLDRYALTVSPKKDGGDWEVKRLAAYKKAFADLGDFGDVASMWFHEIDAPHVCAWRDQRETEVTSGSVLRDIQLLRNVFTVARLEWKWTDKRPFEGIRLPPANPPRKRRPMWQEVRKIVRHLGYVTGEMPETKSQEIAYCFLLALRTALRTSELLRLTDESVNLHKRVLTVKRKTFYLTREVREVPFTPAAARLFLPLKGWGGPLFTVSAGSMDTLFRKARAKEMITGLQFRDSRADAATRLVAKGVKLLELARILDHKNLDLLNRVYFRKTAADIAKGL